MHEEDIMTHVAKEHRSAAEGRRTLDRLAALTGQRWRLNAAWLIILSGAAVLLLSATLRTSEKDAGGAFLGWAIIMAGFIARWMAVRCPTCKTPVEWYRLKTQSLFSKAAWATDNDGDCLKCGYRMDVKGSEG